MAEIDSNQEKIICKLLYLQSFPVPTENIVKDRRGSKCSPDEEGKRGRRSWLLSASVDSLLEPKSLLPNIDFYPNNSSKKGSETNGISWKLFPRVHKWDLKCFSAETADRDNLGVDLINFCLQLVSCPLILSLFLWPCPPSLPPQSVAHLKVLRMFHSRSLSHVCSLR